MAKQTLKIIAEREAQLREFNYSENTTDGTFTGAYGSVTIDVIQNGSKTAWDATVKTIQDAVAKANAMAIVAKSGAVVIEQPDTSLFEQKKQEIQAFSEQYKGLGIKDLNDKEGFKAVDAAKKVVRKIRTTVEAKRKDVKAFYIEEGKKIDDKAKELTAIIAPIEDHLDAQLETFEKWQQAEQERIEAERVAELNRRVDILKNSGMHFNGTWYVVGDTMSMDLPTIGSLSDVAFLELNDKVSAEKKRLDGIAEAQRLEQEQKEAAERERIAEMERKNAELQAQQALLAKQLEDAKINKRKNRTRILLSIGLELQNATFVFRNDFASIEHPMQDILDCIDESFDKAVELTEADINEAKDKQQAKQVQVNERTAILAAMGFDTVAKNGQIVHRHTWGPDTVITQFSDVDFETWLSQCKEHIAACEAAEKQAAADKVRFESNIARLFTLGLLRDQNSFIYKRDLVSEIISVTEQQVQAWPDGVDAEELAVIGEMVRNIDRLHTEAVEAKRIADNEAEARRLEAEKLFTQRVSEISTCGVSYAHGKFVTKNEFGAILEIPAGDKLTNDAEYPNFVTNVMQLVRDFNSITDAERERIAAEKEALKPDLEKAYDYLKAFKTFQPTTGNDRINAICAKLQQNVHEAVLSAKQALDAMK